MTTDDGMTAAALYGLHARDDEVAKLKAEIERLRAELDDQRKDTVCDEQRVADLMADVQRQGLEIERLRGLLREVIDCGASYRARDYSEVQIPHDLDDAIREALGEDK